MERLVGNWHHADHPAYIFVLHESVLCILLQVPDLFDFPLRETPDGLLVNANRRLRPSTV